MQVQLNSIVTTTNLSNGPALCSSSTPSFPIYVLLPVTCISGNASKGWDHTYLRYTSQQRFNLTVIMDSPTPQYLQATVTIELLTLAVTATATVMF